MAMKAPAQRIPNGVIGSIGGINQNRARRPNPMTRWSGYKLRFFFASLKIFHPFLFSRNFPTIHQEFL